MTSNTLRLSVVIPSYNRLQSLIPCLRSLIQTANQAGKDGRLEIIVQDDCSPDFKIEDVVAYPALPARNERNLGFAGNCNAGALRAQGDILLFLNQDTKAHEGWFEPLMTMFENERVGVVGCKLVFPDTGRGYSIQSCGGLFDAKKNPYHRFIGYAADDWRVNQIERVSWMTGGALAIRRELFAELHGFDVGYERGYFEDVDLCLAAMKRGYQIWYCPRSEFEHETGASGGIPAEIFRQNHRRFWTKWSALIEPDTNVVMTPW